MCGDVARFGGYLATRLPGNLIEFPGRDELGRATLTVLVAVAMIGLFVFPAFSLAAQGPYLSESPLPDENPVEPIADNWSVTQPNWSIFAGPGPRASDRYYVFPAETADGEVFDLYNDRQMTYDRPGQQLQRQHGTYRERFYMNHVRRAGMYGSAPGRLADYLCEDWAEEHGVDLTHINMFEVREVITIETIDDPDNRSRSINLISRQSCEGYDLKEIAPPDEFD